MNHVAKPSVLFSNPARSPALKRSEYHSEVICIAEDTYSGRKYLASNLSCGGVFVKTLLPLNTGVQLKCFIHLGDGEPTIEAQAKVAWQRLSGSDLKSPPGMGLQFVGLPEKHISRISKFIESYQSNPSTPSNPSNPSNPSRSEQKD